MEMDPLQGSKPALPLAFNLQLQEAGSAAREPGRAGSHHGKQCAATSSDSYRDPDTISQGTHQDTSLPRHTDDYTQPGGQTHRPGHTHIQPSSHTHPGMQICILTHAQSDTHTEPCSHTPVQA